VKNVYLRQ